MKAIRSVATFVAVLTVYAALLAELAYLLLGNP
jgi:hypothetical protein